MAPPFPLQGHTATELARRVPDLTPEEARKITSAVHRGGRLERAVPGVRRASLEAARAAVMIPALELRAVRQSALDPFVKLLLVAPDGALFEAVRIPLEHPGRYTVCVSSQVGCAQGCAFCATGRLSLVRNLEPWEMVEQVRIIQRDLVARGTGRVHGVVFQGMGEPLSNLDRVLHAIRVLTESGAHAVDAKKLTVCTAGIPAGILRLAAEAPKVRLAVSIGSPWAEVRRQIMPLDRVHPLASVLEATSEHARRTGLAPMWAYTLLAGVNDGDQDARALAALALDFAERAGLRPRLTLLAYNAIEPGGVEPFSRVSEEREAVFRDALRALGVHTHRRYSGGADVGAACGQLAGRAW